MTDIEQDEPVLLLAESVVELVKSQRAFAEAALRTMGEMVEAVRAMPAPVVNVAAAEVSIPEIRVDAPVVNVPAVQQVRIVGLPPLRARVNRDQKGRIETIEEQ